MDVQHASQIVHRQTDAIFLKLNAAVSSSLLVGLVLVLFVGCQSTSWLVKKQPDWSAFSQIYGKDGSLKPSNRTLQTLRQLDLAEQLASDPEQLLRQLQVILRSENNGDILFAHAEIANLLAKSNEENDEKKAFDLYVASAAASYEYLFDKQFAATRNTYDPQFRQACDLYNESLDRAMRLANRHGGLKPGLQHFCHAGNESILFRITSEVEHLQHEDFKKFEFVSDYQIKKLPNHYRTYGLGVPLIAERETVQDNQQIAAHYPPGMSVPVTAYLRMLPSRQMGPEGVLMREAVLELYDPLRTPTVQVADRVVPLESDSTTPLAYFLDNLEYTDTAAATSGLFRPDETPYPGGLYMLEPYQPGKIPVLMVHGIWATPISWMTMFNDLRSIPEIRKHYQFWCYFYPTGEPFVYTAADLREQMMQLRKTLDPKNQEPALEQIVMVGHSMGGLISRLQSVDSGDLFWQQIAEQPLDMAKADPETRKQIERLFFFQANPSVRRVVTIATPFSGSDLSNSATQWIGSQLIEPPKLIMDSLQKLNNENPKLLKNDVADLTPTSLEMLAPGSAALKSLAAAPRAPWVVYHNVIGRTESRDFLHRVTGDGDGVVSIASAQANDVVSEIIVDADHDSIHSHPRTILEVRRILLEHLDALRQGNPSVASHSTRQGDRSSELSKDSRNEAPTPRASFE
jgi:pimeloyl-ACP methyl ester carboxylesterase